MERVRGNPAADRRRRCCGDGGSLSTGTTTRGRRRVRKPALTRLLESQPLDDATIDSFIASNTVPIVEGPRCTFLYRGDADEVNLQHFIFSLPLSRSFTRIEGTDLWYLTMEIPENSRVEYKLEVVKQGDRSWIEDPLNPLRAHDPFGANSVCHSAGYEIPEWALPDDEARKGTLEPLSIYSKALRRDAQVTMYFPSRFRTAARYPLMIVHDGGDYLDFAGMKEVLDNLIHRLEVAEMIVAFTHPSDRLKEYANNPYHARFIAKELVPALEERFPLIGEPRGRCLMGASFGAIAAFSTARRYPGSFGSLLLQSGSFAFSDIGPQQRGPLFEPVAKFVNAYRERPRMVSDRVFVSCGIYESLIYENRSLVPILQSTGMDVRYVEARDGHNWENWRDRMREAFSWLYPGPLRMVYE